MESEFNDASCSTLYDLSKVVYLDEIDRFKNTDFKISIAIAFIGVFLGGVLTYINTPLPSSLSLPLLAISLISRFLIFISVVVALILLIIAINSGSFSQIKLSELITDKFATDKSSANVSITIAATYMKVIENNKSKIDLKLKLYSWSLWILAASIIIFSLEVLMQVVIKYA